MTKVESGFVFLNESYTVEYTKFLSILHCHYIISWQVNWDSTQLRTFFFSLRNPLVDVLSMDQCSMVFWTTEWNSLVCESHSVTILCFGLHRGFSIPFRLRVYLLGSSYRLLLGATRVCTRTSHRCICQSIRSRLENVAFLKYEL